MNGKRKYGFSGIFLVVLMLLLLYYLFAGMRSSGDISYAQLRQLFQQEQVQSFVIRDTRITADLKDGTTATCDLYSFDLFYDDLNELVEQQSASGIITDYNYHADHSTNRLAAAAAVCAGDSGVHPADEPHGPQRGRRDGQQDGPLRRGPRPDARRG